MSAADPDTRDWRTPPSLVIQRLRAERDEAIAERESVQRDLRDFIERVERRHASPGPEDHAVRMVMDDLSALLDERT